MIKHLIAYGNWTESLSNKKMMIRFCRWTMTI